MAQGRAAHDDQRRNIRLTVSVLALVAMTSFIAAFIKQW
jgi:hypothetical protein